MRVRVCACFEIERVCVCVLGREGMGGGARVESKKKHSQRRGGGVESKKKHSQRGGGGS